MFNKFDIESATPATLADRLGSLEARKASIQVEIDATKGAILECGTNKAEGKRYGFSIVSASTREQFSASKAKAMLSAAQISACTGTVNIKASVRIRARKV